MMKTQPAAQPPASPAPKILVAEDDRIILLMLAEGLEEAGFSVLSAQDGLSALALCVEQQPDLALLDIQMPGLTGIELARRLAAETTVPFLFLTAYDDPALIDEAIEAGAFGYLVKPIEVPRILPTLQAALARARDLRASREAQQGLSAAMATNREIATAVGMLMQRHRVTADEAFDAMRRYARDHRQKVTDVAQTVISGSRGLNLGLGRSSGTPRPAPGAQSSRKPQ